MFLNSLISKVQWVQLMSNFVETFVQEGISMGQQGIMLLSAEL